MQIKFEPISDKCAEIVDKLMSAPEMPEDEDVRFKTRLCVEEVVENIVNYAYKRGDGWLEAQTDTKDGALTITLRDAGTPFNPLDMPEPDITLSAEDRQIGGLGIFLCKKMMDSVKYEYKDNCNILTLAIKTE